MRPGTRLGPYEIIEPIGAGGMGTVYRARDPRLGRDVAIKVSAERFSDRFEREARAIAALNHAHICTLHDVGPDYLVMELVQGPTLAERIAAGPMPVEESLQIARQIADALQAAHEKGIVHRDLKSANVKITSDGVVKVLDFGLAKQADSGQFEGDAEHSPTIMPSATRAGVILGTAAYMAPEQARGHRVDKRADIWAFGVVLYEMLAGRRPFRGDTMTDTLAAVLTTEPDWSRVPPIARPLVQRCLAKDPKRRLRDIGDVDLLLTAAPVPHAPRRSWIAWTLAALLLVALAPIAFVRLREQPRAGAPVRFQIPASVTLAPSGNIGLSPDGRYLAFMGAGADGVVRLWLRNMDSLEMRPLPGSETAAPGPPFFWSPDSHFIVFDAGGQLKKLNVSGGPPQTLCDLPSLALGGTWNRRGDILIGTASGGILRLPETGGSPTPVTVIDRARNETSHLLPTFLQDGRHFVYVRVSRGSLEHSGVYIGSLDAKPEAQNAVRVMPYARGLTYAPSNGRSMGRLLFIREGTLLAQPIDERRLELTGEVLPVAEQVGVYLDTGFFSVSANDVLVYRTADPSFPIVWVDRHGTVTDRVSEPGQYASLALSPDGTRAVTSRTNPRDRGNADLWILDLSRGGSPTRFTFVPPGVRADFPVWSPDGTRIAYRLGGPGGAPHVYQKLASGTRDEEILMSSVGGLTTPIGWSPDMRFLLFADTNTTTGWDLWVLPLKDGKREGTTKEIPFVRTPSNEEEGRFSPDGRWVAYVSNESGSKEVYVRAFDPQFSNGSSSTGSRVLVSKGGGTSPRWRRDGKELFYVAADERMMAVEVSTGTEFRATTPIPLFQALPGAIVGDVSADGKRFLLIQSAAAPFTVVLNWLQN